MTLIKSNLGMGIVKANSVNIYLDSGNHRYIFGLRLTNQLDGKEQYFDAQKESSVDAKTITWKVVGEQDIPMMPKYHPTVNTNRTLAILLQREVAAASK